MTTLLLLALLFVACAVAVAEHRGRRQAEQRLDVTLRAKVLGNELPPRPRRWDRWLP